MSPLRACWVLVLITAAYGCAGQVDVPGATGPLDEADGGPALPGLQPGDDSGPAPVEPVSFEDDAGPLAEACDGLDNDEDGQVDEGCPCVPGEIQPCYPAASAPFSGAGGGGGAVTLAGQCAMGSQTCASSGEGEFDGQWGACQGAVTPSEELCGDGVDQDCNGSDTICDCQPSCAGKECGDDGCGGSCGPLTAPCEASYGTCAASGTRTCQGNAYGPCQPQSQDPRPATCAGKTCGDDGCGGYCGAPPHACETVTQQKTVLLLQFYDCLGCCTRDGLYAGWGLQPCSTGNPLEAHYYGGYIPGQLPAMPDYCGQETIMQDYPPCPGEVGPENLAGMTTEHIGNCGIKDPGREILVYTRTCTT